MKLANSLLLLPLLLLTDAAVCQHPLANRPMSALSGKVLTVDGRPVMGEVMAYQMSIQDGEARPIARCSAKTSPEGDYECPAVPAGRYLVLVRPARTQPAAADAAQRETGKATADGGAQAAEKLPAPYPITFYPDKESISDAEEVWLKSGVDGMANIILHDHPVNVLTGIVPTKPSQVLLMLSMYDSRFDLPANFEFDYHAESGRFIAKDIPAGEYLLKAYWFAEGADHHASVIVKIGASMKEIVLREDSQAMITGAIHLEDGVTAALPGSIALECGPWGEKQQYTAKLDERGGFVFPNISSGDCGIHLDSTDKLYVRSVAVKGNVLPMQRITVGPSSSSVRVEVEVSNREGSVHGTVAGADPEAGVVAQSQDSGRFVAVPIDSAGNFAMPELSPGSYRLFAWAALNDAEYKNPVWLHQFENEGATIEVQADQAASVELHAIVDPKR